MLDWDVGWEDSQADLEHERDVCLSSVVLGIGKIVVIDHWFICPIDDRSIEVNQYTEK